jgi:hypothetical protein
MLSAVTANAHDLDCSTLPNAASIMLEPADFSIGKTIAKNT